MQTSNINFLWPAIFVLSYVFVTCTLTILTTYSKRAIEEHDLIVNTRKRRREYVMSIEARIRADEQAESEDYDEDLDNPIEQDQPIEQQTDQPIPAL